MSDSDARSRPNLTVHGIQLKLRTRSKDFSVFLTICDSRVMKELLELFTNSRMTEYTGGTLPHSVKGPRIFLGIGSRPFSKPSIWERPI